MQSLILSFVCFVVCHGGPADHFAEFGKRLAERGWKVEIHACGPALEKLKGQSFPEEVELIPFSLEDEEKEAKTIALHCSEKKATVVTDVGHLFGVQLHQVLAQEKIPHYAYYENPEPYVPGGYSSTAAEVMSKADKILFANAHLETAVLYKNSEEKMDLPQERIGIGYAFFDAALSIGKRRANGEGLSMRKKWFFDLSREDRGEKIIVYIGGNNEEYFSLALPAFLQYLEEGAKQADLSQWIVLFQQHPGAKKENRDAKRIKEWVSQHKISAMPQIFFSSLSNEEAQVMADLILYYQTSMASQFILAKIPTVQVGHKVYEDVLIKEKLCVAATSAKELLFALFFPPKIKNISEEEIKEKLGVRSNWIERLEKEMKKESSKL